MRHFIIFLIRCYQRIKRLLPIQTCRFYPSCSEYMIQCLGQYNIWRGLGKGFARLLRCHPWHTGGYDPVAE